MRTYWYVLKQKSAFQHRVVAYLLIIIGYNYWCECISSLIHTSSALFKSALRLDSRFFMNVCMCWCCYFVESCCWFSTDVSEIKFNAHNSILRGIIGACYSFVFVEKFAFNLRFLVFNCSIRFCSHFIFFPPFILFQLEFGFVFRLYVLSIYCI